MALLIPDVKDCKTIRCAFAVAFAHGERRADACEEGNEDCKKSGTSCCLLCKSKECDLFHFVKVCEVEEGLPLLAFKRKYSKCIQQQ